VAVQAAGVGAVQAAVGAPAEAVEQGEVEEWAAAVE